jgi:hypothetical protein
VLAWTPRAIASVRLDHFLSAPGVLDWVKLRKCAELAQHWEDSLVGVKWRTFEDKEGILAAVHVSKWRK